MNETNIIVFTFLACFNTFLFTYLVVKVSNYLDWKRAWQRIRNV